VGQRTIRGLVAVLSAAGAVALPAAVPGPASAQSTQPTHTAPLSSAWLPHWDFQRAYARVVGNADLFSTASPFWYGATCDRLNGAAGAGSPTALAGLRRAGLDVVPTVTSPMSPQEAIDCFFDPAQRAAHVGRVVDLVNTHGYTGIDVNYENLALTTDPAQAQQVQTSFTTFATDLCAALHAAGRTCVMTVMPRTDDTFSVWRSKLIPAVYDYAALGAVADRVRVMAYDQHAPNTAPGPIAGYPWVQAISTYTAAHVPAHKVDLGIPLYGRDWASGGPTGTVTGASATALAARYGSTIEWDDEQHAPHFSYSRDGVAHDVWFSDARSVGDRLHLARAFGFRAAYWAPGQEDAATWRVVREGSQVLFRDITGDTHEKAIVALAEAAIVNGYGDGTYRPYAAVTRAQMATFLTRALQLPPTSTPAPYRDIGGSVHMDAIARVSAAEIAAGFGDELFGPDLVVTRAQMATFLTRALRLSSIPASTFSDIAGNSHEASILGVAQARIAGGYPDGTFRPHAPVTRGQLATFLTRALAVR
jgi:spore germination protein